MIDINMPPSLTIERKEAATEFLRLIVSGRIDEAYRKYVDMNGKHHNPFFPAGFPALQKAMEDDHTVHPNKKLSMQHVVCDGDYVVIHSHIVMHPGEPDYSVVHIYRFENDKIVELWDCGQLVPPDSPNKDGAF
jgi:predicted SnoaL-like aldol condensation-catalyzing enzyme